MSDKKSDRVLSLCNMHVTAMMNTSQDTETCDYCELLEEHEQLKGDLRDLESRLADCVAEGKGRDED